MEKRIAIIRIISNTIVDVGKHYGHLSFGSEHPVISTPSYYKGYKDNSLTAVWILGQFTGVPIYLSNGTFEVVEYKQKPLPSIFGFVSAFNTGEYQSRWAIEGGSNIYLNELSNYESFK
jgi:hypothetical protein